MPTIAAAILLYLPGFLAPPPHLRVDITIQGVSAPPAFITAAIEEAADIWAAYGVDIRMAGTNDAEDDSPSGSRSGSPRLQHLMATGILGAIVFTATRPNRRSTCIRQLPPRSWPPWHPVDARTRGQPHLATGSSRVCWDAPWRTKSTLPAALQDSFERRAHESRAGWERPHGSRSSWFRSVAGGGAEASLEPASGERLRAPSIGRGSQGSTTLIDSNLRTGGRHGG